MGHLSFTEILDTSLKVSWQEPLEKNGIITGQHPVFRKRNRACAHRKGRGALHARPPTRGTCACGLLRGTGHVAVGWASIPKPRAVPPGAQPQSSSEPRASVSPHVLTKPPKPRGSLRRGRFVTRSLKCTDVPSFSPQHGTVGGDTVTDHR